MLNHRNAPDPCECGLDYVRGLKENEKYHAKVHAEYSCGPSIAALHRLAVIGRIGDLTLHAVDAAVPLEIREKLAHVAMVAQRSMSDYPAGYYGTVANEDQRLYIIAARSRAVGMAITGLDSHFWKLAWGQDGLIELVDKEPLARTGPKIARVWIAANYRRKGLAFSLVTEAARHLATEPSMLGWELPFTEAGSAVVRKVSPGEFLGRCDGFTLQQVLNASRLRKDAT